MIKAEADLPDGVELSDAAVDEAPARAGLRQAMEGAVQADRRCDPAAAPGLRSRRRRDWISEAWTFRRSRLYLVTGDSPIGLRLPLSSLPELAPKDYPHITPVDPYEERGPLPTYDDIYATEWTPSAYTRSKSRRKRHVRTALSVQPRDGALYVFAPVAPGGLPRPDGPRGSRQQGPPDPDRGLCASRRPPVGGAEKSPPIRASLRNVCSPPPIGGRRWRSRRGCTRTPGVPARRGQVHDRRPPYRDRRRRPCGDRRGQPGGLAVPAPARRAAQPSDLLAAAPRPVPICSPACSSGPPARRRGSTRRDGHHYELDIALAMIPPPEEAEVTPAVAGGPLASQPPDRRRQQHPPDRNLHRQALLSGWPHRPPRPGGVPRLRDAPDARMNLAQQLLIRALVCWFWRAPQHGRLVRWGTALHDRFMLPHFLWADFLDVLRDLETAGYAFDPAWVRSPAGVPVPGARRGRA